MWSEFVKNVNTTKVFFFVRFAVSMVIACIYILVAAAIQDFYVGWFGKTKFNYISGGMISLVLGAMGCIYLGRFAFLLVRGWHMGALAHVNIIRKKNLSCIDAGTTVFRKHFTSYGAIYGSSIVINKFLKAGVDHVWDLLRDVPYLSTLERFADFPVVSRVANDIMDTAYDAILFYVVKYTKPGLFDDFKDIPVALRKYLYALPSIMLSSVSAYLLLYFVPKTLVFFFVIYFFMTEGLVAGTLILTWIFPLSYIINCSLLEPLKTVLLVSCFSKQCTEEPKESNTLVESIISEILEQLGISEPNQSEEPDQDSKSDQNNKSKQNNKPKQVEEPKPPKQEKPEPTEESSISRETKQKLSALIGGHMEEPEPEDINIDVELDDDGDCDLGVSSPPSRREAFNANRWAATPLPAVSSAPSEPPPFVSPDPVEPSPVVSSANNEETPIAKAAPVETPVPNTATMLSDKLNAMKNGPEGLNPFSALKMVGTFAPPKSLHESAEEQMGTGEANSVDLGGNDLFE